MMTAEKLCGCDVDDLKDVLKIRLSKKRYNHSLNVSRSAGELAEKYGADKEKARLAGLLHDICKEIPKEEQLKMAIACGRDFTVTEQQIPPLYHAAAGAWYCENVLHIRDDDILNAIRYHTAARAGMSLLEEIIYLADLISEDRDYKDVGKMRRIAFTDLKEAMLEAMRFSIGDIAQKGSLIPENSYAAYNYYAGIKREKSKKE